MGDEVGVGDVVGGAGKLGQGGNYLDSRATNQSTEIYIASHDRHFNTQLLYRKLWMMSNFGMVCNSKYIQCAIKSKLTAGICRLWKPLKNGVKKLKYLKIYVL